VIALCALLGAASGSVPAGAQARIATSWQTTVIPEPQQVQSRARPVKRARTKLAEFATAPFPYDGLVPGTSRPFLDVEQDGRRGHRGPGGRVYWEDERYNDRRVLLHVPDGFDIRRPSVLIVYFHGHGAALERDVYARQRVPAQISKSGVNAVLVAPQLAYIAADSSPGRFWEPGGFARFLAEAAQQLAQMHGDPRSVRAFASMPVVIVGYSGGYKSAAACIAYGGIGRRLKGVVLFDALYGDLDTFADWVSRDRSTFLISAHTASTSARNLMLQRMLAERQIAYASELSGPVQPGHVAFIATGSEAEHRDYLTRAWVADPLADVLGRLRHYTRL
jgi:hypothetical protein